MSSSLFLMYLIDDVITPLLKSAVPDFAGVLKAVMLFGVIYYTGVFCTFIYSRLMVNIGPVSYTHLDVYKRQGIYFYVLYQRSWERN